MSTDPERARRHLVAVCGWRCWSCGTPTRVLDVDHVRPLWSLSDDERREYRWWLPFNLQLLCTPCHTMKTSHEAAARAHFRRTGVLRLDLFATAPTALELA